MKTLKKSQTLDCALRLKPCSHEKVAQVLIPGTLLAAEIYPTRLRIFHAKSQDTVFIKDFPEVESSEKFTVFQDLEKNRIEVTQVTQSGFMRYFVEPGKIILQKPRKEEYPFSCALLQAVPFERLSLGCNKAQDATLIFRRNDLTEIVPIVYALSQRVSEEVGAGDALDWAAFLGFIKQGLDSLFFPTVIANQGGKSISGPFEFLQKSHPFLRALFFREEESIFHILPEVPKEFHVGRLIGLQTNKGHTINLEWTKKCIRRVEIIPACDDSYQFKFSNDIKRFRCSTRNIGAQLLTKGASVTLKKGVPVLLDRFER